MAGAAKLTTHAPDRQCGDFSRHAAVARAERGPAHHGRRLPPSAGQRHHRQSRSASARARRTWRVRPGPPIRSSSTPEPTPCASSAMRWSVTRHRCWTKDRAPWCSATTATRCSASRRPGRPSPNPAGRTRLVMMPRAAAGARRLGSALAAAASTTHPSDEDRSVMNLRRRKPPRRREPGQELRRTPRRQGTCTSACAAARGRPAGP